MSGSLVGRYEHLKNRPKSDQALPLLEKIASQVKPIMAKRSWKVGTLAEFLPSDPSLLGNNMNAGQRINLRLRPPGSPDSFYEYDQLVLVMLHELTHNEHGPHGPAFYKLLAELEEEYYELKRKGYSGEGFHGNGNHLSGLKVNEYQGKERGLLAAEKRLANQRKIGKGGVLGGKSVLGRSMKEVLAEAAERRLRDDKICHTDSGVQAEVEKAARESEGVDADQLEGAKDPVRGEPIRGNDSTASGVSNKSTTASSSSTPQPRLEPVGRASIPKSRVDRSMTPRASSSSSIQPRPQVIDLTDDEPLPLSTVTPEIAEWSCPTCTLLNPISAQSCEACGTDRLGRRKSPLNHKTEQGWFCEFCGSGPRDMSYWSCGECGWVRKWG